MTDWRCDVCKDGDPCFLSLKYEYAPTSCPFSTSKRLVPNWQPNPPKVEETCGDCAHFGQPYCRNKPRRKDDQICLCFMEKPVEPVTPTPKFKVGDVAYVPRWPGTAIAKITIKEVAIEASSFVYKFGNDDLGYFWLSEKRLYPTAEEAFAAMEG